MQIKQSKTIKLPKWIENFSFDNIHLRNNNDKIDLVANLAKKNIEYSTGGPFAAIVLDMTDNKIISIGVNIVVKEKTSIAHAEIIAIMLAQTHINSYRLCENTYELISLAQPCSMCYGAIIWSGIKRLIYGANRNDVENILGFDEGPLPKNWQIEYKNRHIEIIKNVNRKKACEALEMYKENKGLIY